MEHKPLSTHYIRFNHSVVQNGYFDLPSNGDVQKKGKDTVTKPWLST